MIASRWQALTIVAQVDVARSCHYVDAGLAKHIRMCHRNQHPAAVSRV